ncbi:potassium channel family protein [Actinomycetospora lutea]|uniref:potassium channel family protein n=1 Tax=Actinomycetospora lutea TaxID=663604 RepID=UPI0023673448|nr:potassium channel family protein [Actinomycetospora lutea]MDD7938087.1 potassium channel family protein [Actinomycetospora lutea]
MSAPSAVDPAVRPPRRRVIVVSVRAVLTVVVLVTLYYVLPLTPRPGGYALAILLVGLAALTGLIVWQIRAIVRARHPGLRALETLALVIPTFLLVFAAGYYMASQANPAVFSEPLSRSDALYFTITVFATVGFGDISPVAEPLRLVVAVQMLADLLVLGLVLQAVLNAVRRGQERSRSALG